MDSKTSIFYLSWNRKAFLDFVENCHVIEIEFKSIVECEYE